jgi:hypothetical protein
VATPNNLRPARTADRRVISFGLEKAMRNSVNLADLKEMPTREAASLSVEQISMLLEELAQRKQEVKLLDAALYSVLLEKFAAAADKARREAGKDTGTVRLQYDDHVVIADAPKDVETIEALKAMGEPIEDYVTTVIKVSEAKYKAWPTSLQTMFAPARTVGTGKQTFKIEKAKQ